MTRKNKTPNSSILASETWLFTTPSSSCFIHTYISTTFWSATSIFFAHWKPTWVVPLELKCIASKIHTKRYTHKEILISYPYVFFFLQQQPYCSDTHLFTIMSKLPWANPFHSRISNISKEINPSLFKNIGKGKGSERFKLEQTLTAHLCCGKSATEATSLCLDPSKLCYPTDRAGFAWMFTDNSNDFNNRIQLNHPWTTNSFTLMLLSPYWSCFNLFTVTISNSRSLLSFTTLL